MTSTDTGNSRCICDSLYMDTQFRSTSWDILQLSLGKILETGVEQSQGGQLMGHKRSGTSASAPLLTCCSRMRRVRAVVPLGMLMMYFPSISAVTRLRFTGTPLPSSAVRLSTDRGAGGLAEEKEEVSDQVELTRAVMVVSQCYHDYRDYKSPEL